MRKAPAVFAVGAALFILAAVPAAGEPIPLSNPPAQTSTALPGRVASVAAVPFAVRGLGTEVAVTIVDAATGQVLFSKGANLPVQPASALKIVTAVTVLTVLPAETTLRTRLVSSGSLSGGVLSGDLVLVGGGDPTLSSLDTAAYPPPARMSALVQAVRRRGITAISGRIVVDSSAYTGPAKGLGWKPTYVTEGSVAPVSALMVDGAHRHPASTRGARSGAPDLQAGERLKALLK
ncbi:MAG: D-alanyl-D-alanine carboxypeptidase, partial [Actinomycetota bacterium]